MNCLLGDSWQDCRVVDVSLSGALIDFRAASVPAQGDHIALDIIRVGPIEAQVMRISGCQVGVRFDSFAPETRDRLICRLYTEGLENNAEATIALGSITGILLQRAFGKNRN